MTDAVKAEIRAQVKKGVPYSSLAAAFEVSTKTIQRDLDFMRDRLNLPLEYDAARWGYHYTEPVSSFPTLQITEGELFALLVAEKALQQYRGTNFEKPLLSAIKKMEQSLPDTISVDLADVEADHLDYFGDMEAIKSAFSRFVDRLPLVGLLISETLSGHAARIEAYGAVDELNSFLGLLRAELLRGSSGPRTRRRPRATAAPRFARHRR